VCVCVGEWVCRVCGCVWYVGVFGVCVCVGGGGCLCICVRVCVCIPNYSLYYEPSWRQVSIALSLRKMNNTENGAMGDVRNTESTATFCAVKT
jgi:hypothetical protein